MNKEKPNPIVVKKLGRYDCWCYNAIKNLLPQLQLPGDSKIELTKAEFKDCLRGRNSHVFIAWDQTKSYPQSAAGLGMISFKPPAFSRLGAEINDVVVDESHRGRGIGKMITLKLIEIAKNKAEETNKKIYLQLTSRPARKRANKLYTKLGFKLLARAEGEKGTNLYEMILTP